MMQKQQRLILLKIAAISFAVALAFLLSLRRSASAQDQPGRLFEMAGMTMPLEQRVGVDDGADFVVHFSGDTRGTLDACG
jgi:hypothetical protein